MISFPKFEKDKILSSINFGSKESILKTEFFNQFINDLPIKKAETVAQLFTGIQIILDKNIHPDFMIYKYHDGTEQNFLLHNDNLYDITDSFKYFKPNFKEIKLNENNN